MPLTSFYAALTGIANNATAINVIGNNLANINTTSFKTSRTSFSEVLGSLASTTSSGNPIQTGLGSTIASMSPVFTQGSINSTGRSADAAISGNGFFVVSTGNGLGFTRAGGFGFNSKSELISGDGFNVMGYPSVNGKIDTSGVLKPVVIQKGQATAPKATGDISIAANLDGAAAVDTVFSTTIRVFDALGAAHSVSLNFKKTGTGWDWTATVPATDTGGASTDPAVEVGTGSLGFDGAGVMDPAATDGAIKITGLASGADDMDITFSLRDSGGNPLITSYAGSSLVSSTTQNGNASSTLKDISIDSTGVVMGVFADGQTLPLAQLAIANFPNVEGLLKYSGSTFVTFGSSGEPSIGVAGTGGRGTVSGASLESSNVDIAQEFTNLIIAQRGYQASSRVITTTDELYQDAINLKR